MDWKNDPNFETDNIVNIILAAQSLFDEEEQAAAATLLMRYAAEHTYSEFLCLMYTLLTSTSVSPALFK